MKKLTLILMAPLMVSFLFCQTSGASEEPDHITVQHILIAFKGSIPKASVTRTQEQAEKLAKEVFEKAKKGENYDVLVKEYTDDSHPGIYKMANTNITPDKSNQEYSRSGMIPAFGNVGFKLEVNGLGLSVYDLKTSKY